MADSATAEDRDSAVQAGSEDQTGLSAANFPSGGLLFHPLEVILWPLRGPMADIKGRLAQLVRALP